jgi:predicted small lipoprotein YifL
MSRARVPRAFVILVLVSLASCAKKDDNRTPDATVPPPQAPQQNQANLQALIDEIAPDKDTVYVNFSCGTFNSIGLTDAKTNGKPAWAIQRHPNQSITWTVANTVTIDSIKGKSTALPITVDPNEHGGAAGKSFKATVNNPAGPNGTTPFDYLIGLTCKAGNQTTHLLIDPEFILNKP